jgi:hypothetical protein
MLFKESLNTKLEEIRRYVSVSLSLGFESISPHIRAAEKQYIIPYLGRNFYTAIDVYYNSVAYQTAGNVFNELIPYIQHPLILFALAEGAPELGLHISNQGFQIITNENQKQAFQWQVKGVKDKWIEQAYLFLEDLLEYIELNEDKEGYEKWNESVERTNARKLFVRSAAVFNQHFFINSSRRLFTSLIPIMTSVEQKHIKPVIGEDLFDELKEQILDNDVKNENQDIIDLIAPAVVHLSMARGIVERGIEIRPEGLYENVVSQFESVESKNTASRENKSALIAQLKQEGLSDIKALQAYLDDHVDDYPLYKLSGLYVDPDDYPRDEYENNADSGICVM